VLAKENFAPPLTDDNDSFIKDFGLIESI